MAVNFGFYRITHNTLFMVLIGCFTFFVGNCVVYAASSGKKLVIRDTIPGGREDILSVPRIKWYVSAVLAVRILQLALLFMKNGLEAMIINDFELMLTRGAMGHLMISVFPLIPVLPLQPPAHCHILYTRVCRDREGSGTDHHDRGISLLRLQEQEKSVQGRRNRHSDDHPALYRQLRVQVHSAGIF